MAIGAWFSVATPFAPSNAPGAIGLIQIRSADGAGLDRAIVALGLGRLGVGEMSVRRVLDVDECVVARWGAECAHVMPHAGKAVMRAMVEALRAAGLEPEAAHDSLAKYPEATDRIDACLLEALSRSASPLAVDALARHAERWRRAEGRVLADGSPEAIALGRLMSAPLVVGWGPANVGKSSLLNALARRAVSIVADEPGTTRDHVGVTLELDGLAVRWIDAPGIGVAGDGEDRAAMSLAASLLPGAGLIVLMGDASSGMPDPPAGAAAPLVRCGTRSDLGTAGIGWDVWTSAEAGRGIGELARIVRRALLPDSALASRGRWRFDPRLDAAV